MCSTIYAKGILITSTLEHHVRFFLEPAEALIILKKPGSVNLLDVSLHSLVPRLPCFVTHWVWGGALRIHSRLVYGNLTPSLSCVVFLGFHKFIFPCVLLVKTIKSQLCSLLIVIASHSLVDNACTPNMPKCWKVVSVILQRVGSPEQVSLELTLTSSVIDGLKS